jgi:hypothetical protein
MIAPEDRIAKVRAIYGRTIEDIVAKYPRHDIYEILGVIEVLVGSKIYRNFFTTQPERMVFAFTWLGREFHDGGFHQFFVNSAGDFWEDILNGLNLIRDQPGLDLFRRALSIFPNCRPSKDRDTRLDQLEQLEEKDEEGLWNHFKEIDDCYSKTPFPRWEQVFDYVKSHPQEFILQDA